MKWFKNKTITVKLLIGFLIAILISIIVGVVGIINLINLEASADQLYHQNALGLSASGNAATTFQRCRVNVLRLTTFNTQADMDAGIGYLNTLIEEMDADMAELDGVLYSNEARAIFADIQEGWQNYKNEAATAKKFAQNMAKINVLEIINEKTTVIGTEVRNNFLALSQVVETNAQLRFDSMIHQGTVSIWIMISVIAVGLIISILLAVYISRLIGIPVRRMVDAADRLAMGDVDIDLVTDTADEIGKLGEAMKHVVEGRKQQVTEVQRIAEGDLTVSIKTKSDKDVLNRSLSDLVDNLNTLVVSIVASADQVSSGANLVSHSSMALSQGASEQASSVEELTASLEEISSKTSQNAQNAQQANTLAQSAKNDAEAGNAQMRDMLKAMDEISASSANINKIIKVIDDIAFQTNILALNAAVEAARAGQHGKGFAVVAEEVRTLAAKSAQAAKETTDLIEGSIRKVEDGTKIANTTAAALGKIVSEVAEAASLVETIAISSNAQAVAVQQINQGIQQVSQVVQSNAATSEESAAASEELASQAEQLKETVSVFRLSQRYQQKSVQSTAPKLREDMPVAALTAGSAKKPAISLESASFGKY